MADQQNSIKISQLSEYAARNSVHVKKLLRDHTNELLTKLIHNMLDKADDTLFEFSSKADSDRAQQTYLDAMREVRLQRHKIEQGFFSELNNAFEVFEKKKKLPDSPQTSAPNDVESLQLIDDELLEENMAITNMSEKVERLFQRELFEIESRVKAVYKCKNTETEVHPLSPITISNAFGNAFKSMDIEFHVKLIIFKLFDKIVMNNIGYVYKDINALLIKENILPNLAYTYKRSRSNRRPNSGLSSNPSNSHRQNSMEGHGWDSVDTVNTSDFGSNEFNPEQQHGRAATDNLLSTDFGFRGFTPVPTQANGIIGTLSDMQNFISNEGYPEDLKPTDIGVNIINGIQRMGYTSVLGKQALDEKIINMVSMIFDFILEDKAIPRQITALLSRLQIPYLKLALIDKTFLRQPSHPARQILNDMAKASIGWVENPNQGNLHQAIESIVDTILNDYEQDIHLFKQLHEEFLQYWKKEQNTNRSYEERIWKTTEGKERVQYAKNRVDAWVHMWCSREETRKQVATFLKHFWKNTMLYCMHKYGEHSREWRYYIKIINALIWSTTPGKNSEDVKQLINITPLLIRGLNRGMLAVGTHPNTISNIFREISKCHLEIIESGLQNKSSENESSHCKESGSQDHQDSTDSNAEMAAKTVESLYQPTIETELDKPDLEVDATLELLVKEVTIETCEPDDNINEGQIEDEFHQLVCGLEYGDWLEFELDGKTVAAKLAWKSAITSNHLFVGRDGTRLTEKKLAEIAEDLRSGKAKCIDQAPVFERALDAVSEIITEIELTDTPSADETKQE